jgi:hypothetical protein
MSDFCKFCVIDTTSLINFSRTEIKGKRALEYLKEFFDDGLIILESELNLDSQLNDMDEDELEELKEYIRRLLVSVDNVEKYRCSECEEQLKAWYNKKGGEYIGLFTKIDAGEKLCIEASLNISRKNKTSVLFLSDDLDAVLQCKIGEFFKEERIGEILTFYDFVTFIFARFREIEKLDAMAALNDFYELKSRPMTKDFKKEKIEDSKKILENMCKLFCTQKCFN